MTKEKMKELVNKHKVDIVIGAVGIGAIVTGAIMCRHPKGLPYGLSWYTNDKAYRDNLMRWINWAGGHQDGGFIGYGMKAEDVHQAMDNLCGDEPDKYLYKFIVHKIEKSKLEG